MPSLVVGQPLASGAQCIVSGNVWSGRTLPVGGVQVRWISSGGNCFVYLSGLGIHPNSGGPTIGSGAMQLSGGCMSGGMDGFLLAPGDNYFVPRTAFLTGPDSGNVQLGVLCDQSASGIGRLYFEVF